MTNAPISDRKNIIDELAEIRDLVTCAGMCTHAFDVDEPDQALALRTLCGSIALRLWDIQAGKERFSFPQTARAD